MTRELRLEPRTKFKVAKFDPWLGEAVQAEKFQTIYDGIAAIARKMDKANGTRPSSASAFRWFPTFGLPRVSYPMYWRAGPVSQLNRLSTLLSGPLFTSEQHPWPRRTEFAEGKKVESEGYCEPLFQIELELLGKVAGRQIGTGIVQVWMDDWRPMTRLISDRDLKSSDLTPVSPKIIEFFSNGPTDGNVYREWGEDQQTAPWLVSGWQYHSLGRAIHELPTTLDYDLEDLSTGQMQCDIEVDYDGSEADAQNVLDQLKKLESRYRRSNSPGDRKGLMRAGSLFGRFYSVQGYHDDFFENTALTLVDLSDGDTFWWGYGSAQLMTDSGCPGREFCFDWSTS